MCFPTMWYVRPAKVAVERLHALHYSVDFIFLSFGIMGFIVEHWNYKRVTDEA